MNRKKATIFVFIAIIMAGAFAVRFYNFHDWLYFKMDQSRDANLISNAVSFGPGNLPLLGPRAGATDVGNGYLRLGPAFYYFQYLAGRVFNSTDPSVFAYPELFFSIAVLPLLYLFLRLYFSQKISFLVLLMYAFSFLVIQYSRFSWNPNSLPFFVILGFYSLIKFLNEPIFKKKIGWLALWTLAISIGSQLHFFGLFVLVAVSALMPVIHYKLWGKSQLIGIFGKGKLKKMGLYVATIALVAGIVYTPVIISDVMKKGENAKNFVSALGSKAKKKPFWDKVFEGSMENLKYYCLITTSECYQSSAKKNLFPLTLTGIILLSAAGATIRNLRRKKEKGSKKDFLILFLLWIGVFFVFTIPVSFQLRPRFFILVFAVPFISLGIIYEFLEEKYGKKVLAVPFLMTAGILFYNARGTAAWFGEQAKSQISSIDVKRTLILKNKDGVTLGELERVANYIYENHKAGANLYYYVKPEHVSPLRYLFYQKGDPKFNYFPMKVNEDPDAEYFAVTPAHSGLTPVEKKYGKNFVVLESEQFGQLLVSKIDFANRNVSNDFRFNKEPKKSDRIYWKDVFGNKEADKNILEITGDE